MLLNGLSRGDPEELFEMDAAYVKSVTGTALVEGLTSVVTHQPVRLPAAATHTHARRSLARARSAFLSRNAR